ncbi:MAG TPA: lipid-binding SYLF domain-containing protein [Amaricoccus sp.]|nr:lipid-binding SYLF domain-containing protein [Amaricoccus sp.]
MAGLRTLALVLTAGAALGAAPEARAASASAIDARVDIALNQLLAESVTAQALAERALAVLVFPQVVKAGFGLGGQYGEGALRQDDATVGYYSIASASFGFQIGAQAYAEALFFMTPESLEYFRRSKGFEVGADANVAVVNQGVAVDATTSTITQPIVAIVFSQQGLMAGATLEGSKISRIHPK